MLVLWKIIFFLWTVFFSGCSYQSLFNRSDFFRLGLISMAPCLRGTVACCCPLFPPNTLCIGFDKPKFALWHIIRPLQRNHLRTSTDLPAHIVCARKLFPNQVMPSCPFHNQIYKYTTKSFVKGFFHSGVGESDVPFHTAKSAKRVFDFWLRNNSLLLWIFVAM